MNKLKSIAIIPARGGSKRIPRKNIRDFCGQPIIKYSIDAAMKSDCFDEIMISTDDAEIADVAKKFGATVPFLRTLVNSNDQAGLAEVLEEVIENFGKIGQRFDYICCILPTAVFVTPEIIKKSFDILIENNAKGLVPVVKFSYPIQRAFLINEGKIELIDSDNYRKRSQDFPSTFHDSGQFYWVETASFMRSKSLLSQDMFVLEIPETQAQDIDTEEDWEVAEIKYQMMKNLQK